MISVMELIQSQINYWRAVSASWLGLLGSNIDSRKGEAQVKKMVAITAELEGQLQTPSRLSRKWTSVKASLKWDEVKSLLNYSKQIQVTLVLARQTSFE
jgi:hypothetical protein